MTFRAPKGTDDIIPPDSRVWRRVLRAWDRLSELYGYELIIIPMFEATGVFERGVGEGTDVVAKEMYTFEDKGGRSVTLRPEATASIIRAYLQAGRPGIWKTSMGGPMFRYDRPQAGRRRQFFQLDLEYIGEPAPEADTEVIELCYRFFADIALGGIELQLNSIGDPASRAAYRTALLDYLAGRQLCSDCQERLERSPLRVLDCKIDGPTLTDAPATTDYLTDSAAEHYRRVKAGLDRLGITYTEDPHLVRGLDYYTHTVFEWVDTTAVAAQNAVGGGGRYDGLAELLGGPHVPGVGVALGVDRIVLSLQDRDEPMLDAFVIIADPERRAAALDLVSSLRAAGVRVDLDLGKRSVKSQFRAADRRQAPVAVVVGEELSGGKVTLRDMGAGTQELVDVEGLARVIRESPHGR